MVWQFLNQIPSMYSLTQADLITYCMKENVPFTVFEDWSTILSTVQDVVAGKATVEEIATKGHADTLKSMEDAGANKLDI